MTKRTICFVVFLLAVATFSFATGTTEGAQGTVSTGGPTYGGTLTAFPENNVTDVEPGNPAAASANWQALRYLDPVYEMPLMGIWDYGPLGKNEYKFQLAGYIPGKYLGGNLVEKWEITPTAITWHVRPGIMWQSRKGVMEARELVADDIKQDIERFMAGPWGGRFKGVLDRVSAPDKYTLILHTPSYNMNLMYMIGYEDRAIISPPEVEKADPSKYENQTGTGAFVFDEYAVGSYMKFKRNPNYWKTWTYQGKTYKLPFLDEIILPIIPDESTQISALRTAKIDIHHSVKPEYWDNLRDTAKGIKIDFVEGIGGNTLCLNTTKPPFNNIDVRRAMMIATDIKAFNAIWAKGATHIDWFPWFQGDPTIFTPKEKLPERVKELYDYNPAKAKQMLAAAGYPNGFTVELETRSIPEFADPAALVVDQWAKVGVTVKLKTFSPTEFGKRLTDMNYENIIFEGLSVSNPIDTLLRDGETGNVHNYAKWSNKEFDRLMHEVVASTDYTLQAKNMREAGLIQLEEAPYIPLSTQMWGFVWWPWLKGYNGEFSYSDGGMGSQYCYMWIDQALKKQMGH